MRRWLALAFGLCLVSSPVAAEEGGASGAAGAPLVGASKGRMFSELRKEDTNRLVSKLSKTGEVERHSIRGLWLSSDAKTCLTELEDGIRRSCLITTSRALNARFLFVSNGRGLLFTIFRNSEMVKGSTKNGYTAYRDRAEHRVWSVAADVDEGVGYTSR